MFEKCENKTENKVRVLKKSALNTKLKNLQMKNSRMQQSWASGNVLNDKQALN